jgi:transporter family-2 protein
VVVTGNTFLMPRLGAVYVFVITFTAQMLVRMLISHFGILESPVSPINGVKVIGGVLLVLGAVLMIRN